MKSFIISMGPIYIKFGQILALCPEIVGDHVANELRVLHDDLSGFDEKIVSRIVTKELGPIDKRFKDFDLGYVSAASIAQVHRAKLHTGEDVAVKILRPGILHEYNKNIGFLYFIANLFLFFTRDRFMRLRPIEVVDFFACVMKQETNLLLEAATASEMRDIFSGSNDTYIPKVFWEHTTSSVLVMEWINGTPFKNISKTTHNTKSIAQKIAVMFFHQAYQVGIFHADLHPGNIIITKENKIGLLDFGIVGRLPIKDRLAVAEILSCFIKKDYLRIAEIHFEAGYIDQSVNKYLFAQYCRSIGETILDKPVNELSVGRILGQLFKITEDFQMKTQIQLLLLQKTTIAIEAIGKSLDPDLNLWYLAKPWIKDWAVKNISFEAKLLRKINQLLRNIFGKSQ